MSRLLAALLVLFATATSPLTRAQDDVATQAFAKAMVSQAMIAALEAGSFVRARNLCDQLILWEPDNPVHHYNLACVEAKAGSPRRSFAFAALEQAVTLGFNDAEHLKADPDFRSIRDDPRFAELVRRTTANASATAALESLAIPARAPRTPAATAAVPPNGLPCGLFLATRPPATTAAAECTAWFFAADGRVFQNPREGIDAADLSTHRGPKGTVRLAGHPLEITWGDGTKAAAPLTRRDGGFAWDGLFFSAATPFAAAANVTGTYVCATPLPEHGELAELPRSLDLRADTSATWTTATDRAIAGRWDLRGFSLRLIEADGTVLQLLACPLDARPAAKPARILLGGVVFRRT